MENDKRPIAILNLTGELSSELGAYFASRKIEVIDPFMSEEVRDWTHIITKDIHHFDHLNAAYDLVQQDRFIISLSKVSDLQNFALNNGNLIFDECWLEGHMGSFIIDKYFHGYGGIALGDNYPTFREVGSFNVTNPFSTGDHLDRLVHQAYEAGVDALSTKTYFDHFIMFAAGLKTKGKAGLPFEISYGTFEDIFAVQVHFFSQHLNILDFATSLNSFITKRAEEYLLNVAVQAADFFDFSYLPEVNKVIVTALWTKDERIQFENRGLMFTAVTDGGLTLTGLSSDGSGTPFLQEGAPIEDHTEKVFLTANLPEGVTATTLKGGDNLSDDEEKIISGGEVLQELVQTVKGRIAGDKSIFKLGGDKLDIDKTVFKIASSIEQASKEKNMEVRSLGNLPNGLKTGLFDFARSIGKSPEDITAQDLDLFESKNIAEILKNELAAASRSLGGISPAEELKAVKAKLRSTEVENQKYLDQLKTLATEVKLLKETRNKLAEMNLKAAHVSEKLDVKSFPELNELQERIGKKTINEVDLQKMTAVLDAHKETENKLKKLELELIQKDMIFTKQIEKSERDVYAKETILIKSKESFTKLMEKKDKEVADLRMKAEQLTKVISNSSSSSNNQILRDLEKQNHNLNKQLEMYKLKISSMVTNLQPSRSEDSMKEDSRKLQMLNQQMKNKLGVIKKDLEKLQSRTAADNSLVLQLKQEKAVLEQQLKKAIQESKLNVPVAQAPQNDQELKRLNSLNQQLETQLKDSSLKISTLETKLIEALKASKSVSTTEVSSTRMSQLEASVKKLTADLLDAKNQVGEGKKEVNKIRQEKTALQNQLDRTKKDLEKLEKSKPAAQKKAG